MRSAAIVALTVALATACGGSPTSPSADALSEQLVTEHHVFHYAPGDSVDGAAQEAFHAWAVAELGVTPPRVTCNKYRDRAHMSALTGRSTNDYAEVPVNTVHSIWRLDGHEAVHVYAGPWGFPVALFVAGLAVAYDTNPLAGDVVPKWSARHS